MLRRLRQLWHWCDYRSQFAEPVDREIRRRLGHGETQQFKPGGVVPKPTLRMIGDGEREHIIVSVSVPPDMAQRIVDTYRPDAP